MANVIWKRSFRLFWPRSISTICLLKISHVFVNGASLFFFSFLAAQNPLPYLCFNLLLEHYSSILTELTMIRHFFIGQQSF